MRGGFEIVDCPPLTAQLKNSSDIRIVMDVRDYLTHETYFDEFIILSGDADFTLRVVARDIADYDRFLQTFLFQLPGVSHVRSSIALREIKYTTDLPLDAP